MKMPHDLLMMAHDVFRWNLESREVANPSLAGGGANGTKMMALHHRSSRILPVVLYVLILY
jgi:hypothetical protein